jgi:hypothetical protein
MKLKHLTIVVLFAMVLIGCMATTTDLGDREIPTWYFSGEIPGYGISDHLVGIGEGATLEDAVAGAQAMIAGQLKVSVVSTMETFRQETSIGGDIDFFETFSESSRITVDETLQGSRIIAQEQVEGTHYVYAALHIQTFLAKLRSELADLASRASNHLSKARDALDNGQLFIAMEQYRAAYDLLVEHYTKRSYVKALSPSQGVPSTYGAQEVVSEIRSMFGSLRLNVVSGDNQQVALGTDLQPVVFEVHYLASNNERIPIAHVPITIRTEDRSSLGRHTTDANGRVSVTIPSSVGGDSVVATIDLHSLMGEFSAAMGRPEAVVHFSIMQSDDPIPITLEFPDRLSSVERSVETQMEQLGFTPSQERDRWLLRCVCEQVSQQKLDSYQGPRYIVTVELELTLVDLISEQTVSKKRVAANGMSGIDEEAAFDAACNMIAVPQSLLASLLGSLAE